MTRRRVRGEPRPRRAWWRRWRTLAGSTASTQAVGLLVAALVTTAAVSTTISLMARQDGGAWSASESSELRSVAHDLLERIVASPGRTHGGSAAWHADPDALALFGLAAGSTPHFLAGDKIQELRRGGLTADDSNGRADYEEVRTALGLRDHDFHLRSYPLVYSVDDPRWTQYRGLHVAYVAEHVRASGSAPDVTVTAEQVHTGLDGYVTVRFTIDCASGPAEDVYLLTTRLDTGDGRESGIITRNSHSPVVTCPGTTDFLVRWENLDWANGDGAYTLTWDIQSLVTNERVVTDATHEVTLRTGARTFTLSAEAESHTFDVASESPAVLLDKFARDGGRLREDVPVTASLYAPDGTLAATESVTLPRNQDARVTFTGVSAMDGTWVLRVDARDEGGDVIAIATERFTFPAGGPLTPPDVTPSALADKEMTLLEDLVRDFDRTRYTGGGDVFRDHKEDTLKRLAYPPHGEGVLDDFDVVVVGSNANTQALGGAFAESLRAWVESGGTLIVLGSEEQGAQWLQSARAFAVHFDSGSGGIGTPDESHPLLHAPDALRYRAYENTGRTYRMTGDAFDGFTHVLVESYSDTESQTILALSNAGVYGDGTVILTSLIPTNLLGGGTDDEPARFLNNLLSRSLDTLHLDYGPPIPEGVSVGSATRLAVVPHPREPGLEVEVRLVLYAW